MAISPLGDRDTSPAPTTTGTPGKAAVVADPVASTGNAPVAKTSSAAEVKKAVDNINQSPAIISANLNFSQDQETGTTVIKVTDNATNTLIRQIPSEEALAISKAITEADKRQGLLINNKA